MTRAHSLPTIEGGAAISGFAQSFCIKDVLMPTTPTVSWVPFKNSAQDNATFYTLPCQAGVTLLPLLVEEDETAVRLHALDFPCWGSGAVCRDVLYGDNGSAIVWASRGQHAPFIVNVGPTAVIVDYFCFSALCEECVGASWM